MIQMIRKSRSRGQFWGVLAVSFGAISVPNAFADLKNQGVPNLRAPGVIQFKKSARTVDGKSLRGVSKSTFVDTMAKSLETQYQTASAAWSMTAPTCDSKTLSDYLLAAQIRGEFEICLTTVLTCIASPVPATVGVLTQGAQCAKSLFDPKSADQLFVQATAPAFAQDPLQAAKHAEAVFEYAQFLFQNSRAGEIRKTLELSPTLKVDAALWEGVIRRQAETDLVGLTKKDIDAFIVTQVANSLLTDSFREKLWAAQIDIAGNDYRYPDAIALLKIYSSQFKNPLHWFYLGYSILYAGLDQDFAQARKIYDVYDRYSHAMTTFPVEQNTHDYSELYGSVCANELTQGQDKADLGRIRSDLRKGNLTATAARGEIELLNTRVPNRADILATLGGLQFIEGNLKDAQTNLWKSHTLCRYYNRANWGLVQIRRQKQYESLPDYSDNLKRLTRETLGLTATAATESYILNWKSLPATVQTRILYGARIWTDFFEAFQKEGLTAYIKYAFDLLSDSPGLTMMADARIGGSSYPNDNRLWDDVRGVGGDSVVADLGEVFQTVQGDYNLLGHEIAHQFQFFVESLDKKKGQCFEDLYDAAKKAGRFPDGYSAYNKEEYFAQGVTYWLVPSDVSSRFGLNRSWVKTNDPDQMSFIESIYWSGGDVSKISCVRSVNPVVVFETTEGKIEMELFEKEAPVTVANFLKYIDGGLYDQTIFHRVIADFVVQGGGLDIQQKEIQDLGTIVNEAKNGIPNHRGALAMARRAAKDSASRSFYFNVKENAHLNHKDETDAGYGYAVFGKVTEGLDVIDQIAVVATDATDQPLQNRVILSAKRK